MVLPSPSGLFIGRHFKVIGGAAFRSFRCLWMLEELGIPYEHVPAMPQSRKIKAYHPLGKVPALIETIPSENPDKIHEERAPKEFVMYESAAINTYLGDLVNAYSSEGQSGIGLPQLVPLVGTQDRGLYEQTVSCIMTELDSQALWIHRKHETMGKYFGHIPDAVQHAKHHFQMVNAALAQQLHNNKGSNSSSTTNERKTNTGPYLVGSHFTAADILYVHCLEWSQSIGWDEAWKKDVKLCEYFHTCQERPAFQRVAAMRAKEEVTREQQSKL